MSPSTSFATTRMIMFECMQWEMLYVCMYRGTRNKNHKSENPEFGCYSLTCTPDIRGPPLDIWGEAWSFCLAIFIYFTREFKSFNFFHHRIGWKYLFQYLYYINFNSLCGSNIYFHHILWPFIYFTHFSYKNIYFQKTSAPPPPAKYSNGGPLIQLQYNRVK